MADELFADGSVSGTGEYDDDGKRHGPWKFWYANGQEKAVGVYLHGALDGPWIWWHSTTGEVLQEGAFDNNTQIGPWKRYWEDGSLKDAGNYSAEGKKIGDWVAHKKPTK